MCLTWHRQSISLWFFLCHRGRRCFWCDPQALGLLRLLRVPLGRWDVWESQSCLVSQSHSNWCRYNQCPLGDVHYNCPTCWAANVISLAVLGTFRWKLHIFHNLCGSLGLSSSSLPSKLQADLVNWWLITPARPPHPDSCPGEDPVASLECLCLQQHHSHKALWTSALISVQRWWTKSSLCSIFSYRKQPQIMHPWTSESSVYHPSFHLPSPILCQTSLTAWTCLSLSSGFLPRRTLPWNFVFTSSIGKVCLASFYSLPWDLLMHVWKPLNTISCLQNSWPGSSGGPQNSFSEFIVKPIFIIL